MGEAVDDKRVVWYEELQKHARANYNNGWDWIVECVDLRDFKCAVIDARLDTWDKVLLYYTEITEIRRERYEDVRAEADDGW